MENQVMKIVSETLSPNNNFMRRQWDSIGRPLCKGILSDQKYLGGTFSFTMRIIGTLQGLAEITLIMDKIYSGLVKKLSLFDKENFKMVQSLQKSCTIDLVESEKIVKLLIDANFIIVYNKDVDSNKFEKVLHVQNTTIESENNLFFYCGTLKVELEGLKFEQFNEHLKKEISPKNVCVETYGETQCNNVMLFFSNFVQESSSFNIDFLNQIMKIVSDLITDQVLRITQSHVISPWSSYAMGKITANISNSIQNSIIQNELRNELESLNNELEETKDDLEKIKELKAKIDEKITLKEKNQTYAVLTMHHAKKFTIAYSQCEIIHFSKQNKIKNNDGNDQYGKIRKNVQEAAHLILNGEPANLAVMFALESIYEINLKIVDDADYQPSVEDIESGTQFIVFISNDGEIGHYTLLNSDPRLASLNSDNNKSDYNCGYDCIQQILKDKGFEESEISISKLRSEAASYTLTNSETFSKALSAQEWITTRYPNEAVDLLGIGGNNKKRKRSEIDDENPHLSPEEVKELLNEIDSLIQYYNLEENDFENAHYNGRLNYNDASRGGSYDELDNFHGGRKGIFEVNHMPPNKVYDKTAYSEITYQRRPCILMDRKDHKDYLTTGHPKRHLKGIFETPGEYNRFLGESMNEQNFFRAMQIDIRMCLGTADNTLKYAKAVRQIIKYCGKTIKRAPKK